MSRIYTVTDVPESELEEQMNILRQDGALEVSSEKQNNNLYTIKAVYPNDFVKERP